MGRIDHTSPVPPRSDARPTAPRVSRSALALALLLLATATVAGCGGSKPHAPSSHTSPSSSPSTSDQAALDPGFGVAKVGQCFSMTPAQSVASVAAGRRVSCRQPHTSVVAFVGYVATAITPATSVAERRAAGQKVCQPAYQALVGGTLADRAQSLLTWTLFTPSARQLEHGARWVRCDVLARSGNALVALPAATPVLAHGVPENLRVCLTKSLVDVTCAGPHAFRVAAVFQSPGTTYPGVGTQQARLRCRQLTRATGGYFQLPAQAGWTAGDRFVRCLTGPPPVSPTPTPGA